MFVTLIMAALRSRCGHYILPCGFFLLSFFLFSSPNIGGRRLDVYHTSTAISPPHVVTIWCTSAH